MTDLYKASLAAEQAAYAAGTHLQASRSRLSEVMITRQSPGEVVSAIDQEARRLIREVVLRQFPQHGFIDAGLGAEPGAPRPDDRPHWIASPLDGSANYQRGYPQPSCNRNFPSLWKRQTAMPKSFAGKHSEPRKRVKRYGQSENWYGLA